MQGRETPAVRPREGMEHSVPLVQLRKDGRVTTRKHSDHWWQLRWHGAGAAMDGMRVQRGVCAQSGVPNAVAVDDGALLTVAHWDCLVTS